MITNRNARLYIMPGWEGRDVSWRGDQRKRSWMALRGTGNGSQVRYSHV